MTREAVTERRLSTFEKYLTVWVGLCIVGGIVIGRISFGIAVTLDSFSVYQVSIPIAIALFFMMYPILVKIDFAEVLKAARTPKPVALTLIVNWASAICSFLGGVTEAVVHGAKAHVLVVR